jgi:large subunit ribosomal protein L3
VAGSYAKAGVEPGEGLWEFRATAEELAELHPPGSPSSRSRPVTARPATWTFAGTTIGKGYAGTIKRHHFSAQDATHGNSVSHRAPGSIGQRQFPGRVFPGKRMSGHLGAAISYAHPGPRAVVRVDADRGLVLVRGAVPGHRDGSAGGNPHRQEPQGGQRRLAGQGQGQGA